MPLGHYVGEERRLASKPRINQLGGFVGGIRLNKWFKRLIRKTPLVVILDLLRTIEEAQRITLARLDAQDHAMALTQEHLMRLEASEKSLELAVLDTHLALGRVLRQQGRLYEAEDCFQAIAARTPDNAKALSHIAQIYVQLGSPHQAVGPISRALTLDPVTFKLAEIILKLSVRNRAPALPRSQRPVRKYPSDSKFTIATSLMPRRIEDQRQAIKSWLKLGFDVISVNTMGEIQQLHGHFPEVRFHEARRSAMELCGKPLIPIEEIIEALKQSGSDLVGIVNSDIVFDETPAFADSIRAAIGGCLVLGNRIDRDRSGSIDGRVYVDGYDFFFLEASDLPRFAQNDMVMGLPWWDYWMPLTAHLAGLNLKLLIGGRAVHFVHPTGYDLEFVPNLSGAFVKALATTIRAAHPVSDGELIRFTQTLFLALDLHLNDFKRPFSRDANWALVAFANFLIMQIASPIRIAASPKSAPVDVVELYKTATP